MTPKQLAEKSAAAMWSDDRASAWFGFELMDVDEGCATLAMTVAPHHLNGHDILHGGITFALADSAFAFACNSRNQATVAMHNVISYLNPARRGDRLTATAREVTLEGRNGIYDVRVQNQDAVTIAEFRGISRAVGGQLFEPAEAAQGE